MYDFGGTIGDLGKGIEDRKREGNSSEQYGGNKRGNLEIRFPSSFFQIDP